MLQTQSLLLYRIIDKSALYPISPLDKIPQSNLPPGKNNLAPDNDCILKENKLTKGQKSRGLT